MNEWIDIDHKMPPSGVRIKIMHKYDLECHTGNAIYAIYDVDECTQAHAWTIEDGYNCPYKPTHWMLIEDKELP